MSFRLRTNVLPKYTGKKQPEPDELWKRDKKPISPYLPDPPLVEAVNLAIYLERPLLIKGEPGCGKTRLARAVAYELDLPYEPWYVKSNSRARDGFYSYDAVGRLRDAQLTAGRSRSFSNQAKYLRWEPLGRAFLNSQPTVVLIDEIDKADIDFPNDLLLELDELRFFVQETGQEIQAVAAPIVFVTSNDEKDLPDAFLRRCLFHYIDFPNPQRLVDIVQAHFPESSKELVGEVVKRFQALRDEMYAEKGEAGKKVTTSELIDWFSILRRHGEDEAFKQLKNKLPFPSVLLKSWDDHRRYLESVGAKSSP